MGFKCRLFGHSYGPPEAERSREEDGDEVVVTVRNVKRCERCGDERTVNQTKEVTSVRTPEEVGLDAEAVESSGTAAPDADPATPETGAGPAAGESPVTPVDPDATPAPGTSDPVDATVGADASPDPSPDPDPASAAEADVDGEGTAPADDRNPTPQPADADPDDEATVEEPDASTVDADAGADPAAGGTDDGWATGSDDWDDVDPDPDVDDAVILDDTDGERDEVQWPEDTDAAPDAGDAVDSADPAVPSEAGVEADEAPKTDAEIIDGEEPALDSEGTPGEWPEHEDAGTAGGWPDHDGADEGYSAAPNTDVDAEFVGNGLTPEVNGGAPDDPDAVDGITVGGGAAERTFADAEAGADADADADTDEGFVSVGDSTAEDVPADRVEFYCPNCGHARVAGASSIRAGDICPECKKGYIAERER
jgi:predicted RNA-binding Zn-ribbon protein involved in translation (DUF1610 family)